jgi:hypothetical protein
MKMNNPVKKVALIPKANLTQEELYESQYWSKHKFLETVPIKGGIVFGIQAFIENVMKNGFDPKEYVTFCVDDKDDLDVEYTDWQPEELEKLGKLGVKEPENFAGIIRTSYREGKLLLSKYKCGIFTIADYDLSNSFLHSYACANIKEVYECVRDYFREGV